ncbi:MAG: DUF3606 domain-containing protein [Bacteroidota bacterium]
MLKDTLKEIPRQRNQVNISDRLELEYWMAKFRVGRDELRWAVHNAGSRLTAVEAALQCFRRC